MSVINLLLCRWTKTK